MYCSNILSEKKGRAKALICDSKSSMCTTCTLAGSLTD